MSSAQHQYGGKNGDGGEGLYTFETREPGGGLSELLVRSGDPAVIANARHVFELLEHRLAKQSFEGLSRLIESIPLELPGGYDETERTLLRRNAEARQRFLDEHRVLDATEVHVLSGSRAKNEHAAANRWREQGRIFAVGVEGKRYYPAFQFEHGESKRVIRRVIGPGAPHHRGWPLALWLNAPNGWLADTARPVDLIDRDPEAVIEALGNENTPVG